ncbi:MAG: hypothetical protein JWM59_4070 [Verrucomicrobiales bacterium]|nr:hypothetical protein [Verrucomicrobiales bacterium]
MTRPQWARRKPKVSRLPATAVGILFAVLLLPVKAQDSWPQVLATLGNLTTVAGSTFEAANNGNEWLPAYEGLRAFDPSQQDSPPHLSEPHMAMDDAYGNIYIADKNGHGIRRISPQGVLTTVAGRPVSGTLASDGDGPATERVVAYPNGLYVLPDGTLYILEQGITGLQPRIRRVGRDGQMTTLITPSGGGSVIFNRGLWVARDQSLLYFCSIEDGQGIVRKWTPAGGSVILATMPAGSEPGNLDVDAQGFVFQADRGLHIVFRIDPATGEYTVAAGNGATTGGGDGQPATATGLEEVRGIAFHPLGGYFVCTHRGSALWYVGTDGIIHKVLSGVRNSTVRDGDGQPVTANPAALKISEPRSIRVGYNGDLILTTNDCGWIRVVRSVSPPPAAALSPQGNHSYTYNPDGGMDTWIERTSSFQPYSWRTLAAFPFGTPGSGVFTDPVPPPGAAFYRLVRTRHWP